MKIEVNPERISDADEAWQAGWESACAYRNGNLERAVEVLKAIAMNTHPDAFQLRCQADIFLKDNGLYSSTEAKCLCGEINARHCPVHNELDSCVEDK